MRYDLTEDQELVRETARRFLEKEAPLAAIRKAADDPAAFGREWWRKASELGWAALGAPEEAGGYSLSGNPAQDLAVIAEEIGRLVGPGYLLPTAVALSAFGEDRTRDALAGEAIAGETVIGWAYGEPGNVWEPQAFKTTLEARGDAVVLDGAKAYVEGGADADALLVTARSEGGLSQVLVRTDAPGVTVTPARSVDLVRRFAVVAFDKVELPRSALVGEVGGAELSVRRQLNLALLLQCAETNGALERAFEFTVDYMRDRYAFGRPIASYQALKHRLADLLVQIHSCMATTDAALAALDAGAPDAAKLAHIAKAYVAAKSVKILGDLVQLTGGIGVTWEHDLHLYERRIAVNRAVLGTPEEHRARVHQLLAA